MMAQLSPFLDMSTEYLINQYEKNLDYYHSEHKKPRPWSFGKLYNSLVGVYAVGGGTTRTPGRYYAVDPESGKETDRPLRDTHEYVHPSVRTRFVLGGPGVEDDGVYEPEALDDWRLVVQYHDGDRRSKPDVFWKARFSSRNVSTRILPESPLWDLEKKLLRMDPEMEDEVFRPPPTKPRRGD
jgi:hypothetical protein